MKPLYSPNLSAHDSPEEKTGERSRAMTPPEPQRTGANAEGGGPEGAAEIDNRVSSMLPDELLQPNEIIILLLKPSLWFILLPCLSFLIGLAVLAGVAIWLRNAGHLAYLTRQDIVLCCIGLAGIRLFWQFLEWLSRVYVLTDQRVIRLMGFIRAPVLESPV